MSTRIRTCSTPDCWREPYDGHRECSVHAELNADGVTRAVAYIGLVAFVIIAVAVVLAAAGVYGMVTP